MVDVTDLVTVLSAVSSLAVIAGAFFIVFQLRQNAKLIEATLRQSRADVSMRLLERITDESFPRRRRNMHQVLRRFKESEWRDAFESADDLEVRNFAYLYELIGLLVRHELVDKEIVLDTLQYLVVRDWEVYAPHVTFVAKQYGVRFNAFSNFEWLATEARAHLDRRVERQQASPGPAS